MRYDSFVPSVTSHRGVGGGYVVGTMLVLVYWHGSCSVAKAVPFDCICKVDAKCRGDASIVP